MPSNGKANGRFELPALAPINFNLTDGTNIPPPPDSPVEEKPPPPTLAAAKPIAPPVTTNTSSESNGPYTSSNDDRGRSDVPPASPASSRRPSSIRRFLSRKSLNANYTNGTNTNESFEDLHSKRPESPRSFMDGRPALKKAKSGSWFSILGGSGNKRSSVIYEAPKLVATKPETKVTPPPKLPELNQLKSKVQSDDGGSLGADDMFKNIK
ncbi:hypothetical protein BJ878DRAFT_481797 [Calycina marina]|uniref:Uncharacterized protein n=1 Tax=Calycina marina TaxID=1763456 RepID=A0A9P7YZI7_9HELO|nr:hypothetical protein BJ878DRAFT_481797 [Calycina marina]